jgi:hypothetical protein
LTVRAENAKNRKEAVLPLKLETAEAIKNFVGNKLPEARAFSIPDKTYLMLKEDLERAKIPYKDEQGRYADFHSLRHTDINLMLKTVAPSVAPFQVEKMKTNRKELEFQTKLKIIESLVINQ